MNLQRPDGGVLSLPRRDLTHDREQRCILQRYSRGSRYPRTDAEVDWIVDHVDRPAIGSEIPSETLGDIPRSRRPRPLPRQRRWIDRASASREDSRVHEQQTPPTKTAAITAVTPPAYYSREYRNVPDRRSCKRHPGRARARYCDCGAPRMHPHTTSGPTDKMDIHAQLSRHRASGPGGHASPATI